MPTITTRPTVYNVVVSTKGQAVKFDVPDGAVWFAMKARDDIIWSPEGTEGNPISSPYSELDAGEAFSLPDILNNRTPLATSIFFDVLPTGSVPAVVEVVVA